MRIDKALVVGAGSAGRRQVRVLQAVRNDLQIFLLPNRGVVSSKSNDNVIDGATMVATYEEANRLGCQALFLCNPSSQHLAAIERLYQPGVKVFIEKPVASDLDSADSLAEILKETSQEVMIGYNMRYLPSLVAFRRKVLKKLKTASDVSVQVVSSFDLSSWRPGTNFLEGVSANKNLGGGALNELSHEIDYLIWFFGMPISVEAKLTREKYVELDVEDTVTMRLVFYNENKSQKIQASVHLDFTRDNRERFCEIHSTDVNYKWDGVTSEILVKTGSASWRRIETVAESPDTSYKAQVSSFLTRAEAGKSQIPNLQEGVDVMRVIQAARRSSFTDSVQAMGTA